MRRAVLPLLSLCVLSSACVRMRPTSFEPEYLASEAPPLRTTLPSCAVPLGVEVADGRNDQETVGVRFSEDEPRVQYPIQADGDIREQVRDALVYALVRSGQAKNAAGEAQLRVMLTQLRLEEKVFHNAEYDAQVGLEVMLYRRDATWPCWSGQVTGVGENYGRAGSEENYQETLSRALEHAAGQLLAAPGLSDALCGLCSD